MHAAKEAYALGAKIIAVSDVSGGLFNPDGINISELVRYVKENKVVVGFPGAEAIASDEVLFLDCDVLAPCALDGVINSTNCNRVIAKIIVEGANGPLTINASEELHNKGYFIIPDILANGGGVVVSYFEWVQDIVWLFWSEDEVRKKLRTIMYRSYDTVFDFHNEKKVDLRISAMAVALKRLEKAMKLRGQAW